MIGTIIELFATLADVLFMVWFVPKFNGVSIKKRPISLIWALVLLIFQLLADRFLAAFDLLYVAIDFIIVLFFSISLQKGKNLWSVFSAAVYVIVIMLSTTFVFTIFSLFTDNIEVVVQGDISYIRLVFLLICKTIHFTFYRLLLLLFKKDNNLDIKNSLLSVLFNVVTAIELGIILEIAAIYDLSGMGLWVTILSIFMILQNIILYLMINQIQKLLKNKYELSLIREKIDSEKSRVEEATVVWNNIRKVRHDLKNHFAILKGKLEEEDMESCKKYLSELNNTVENMGNLIKSGNSIIDYLINSKLSNLNNVKVLISGYVGNYSDIDEMDLACILGNVLDNAIEAQKKVTAEKRIELHFLYKNAARIIVCKNTVGSSVLKNNKDLLSTKDSSELHGLGHRIVESTVKKYGGIVDYYEDGEMFGVQILLPIKA
jgi:hypothetical protein